jgi:hypothetical protein
MRKHLKKKLALHKETLQTLDLAGVAGGKLAPVTFTCDTYQACSYTCNTSNNGACNSVTCYTTTTG